MQRGAREPDATQLTDRAVGAVRPDEPVAAQVVLPADTGSTGVANGRHDTCGVLLHAHQLGVLFDLAAKLHQAPAKLGLDVGLRNEHCLPAVGRSAADG